MIWISKTADRNPSNACEFRVEIHPFMGTTTTSAKNQLLNQPASQPATARISERQRYNGGKNGQLFTVEIFKRCWLLAGIRKEEGEVERFQTTTTRVTTPSKRRRSKTKYIQEEQVDKREKRIIINSAAAATTTTTVPQSNSHWHSQPYVWLMTVDENGSYYDDDDDDDEHH